MSDIPVSYWGKLEHCPYGIKAAASLNWNSWIILSKMVEEMRKKCNG